MLTLSAGAGSIGFYVTRERSFHPTNEILDAFHNACMLLAGMGPVIGSYTTAGMWLSGIYTLLSVVILISNITYLLSPAIHRFYHKLHLEE